jgi:Cdc6-like AAA superfamily ATPase
VSSLNENSQKLKFLQNDRNFSSLSRIFAEMERREAGDEIAINGRRRTGKWLFYKKIFKSRQNFKAFLDKKICKNPPNV